MGATSIAHNVQLEIKYFCIQYGYQIIHLSIAIGFIQFDAGAQTNLHVYNVNCKFLSYILFLSNFKCYFDIEEKGDMPEIRS